MKTGKIPYKDLATTLQGLKRQVQDSMPYVEQYVPDTISSPEELFYYLKKITKYKNDPAGNELLQTIQTLFEESGGKGDCDCFTILSLASFYYLDFLPAQVVLVSNQRHGASHIYTMVEDGGEMKIFDLTNPYYDTERTYKYKQVLDFDLYSPMTLELRDGGGSGLACRQLRDRNTGQNYFLKEGMDDGLEFGGRTRARHNARNAGRIEVINAEYAAKAQVKADKEMQKDPSAYGGDDTGGDDSDVDMNPDSDSSANPDQEQGMFDNYYHDFTDTGMSAGTIFGNMFKSGKKQAAQDIVKEGQPDKPANQPAPEQKKGLMKMIQDNPIESAVVGAVIAWIVTKQLDKHFGSKPRRRSMGSRRRVTHRRRAA